MAIFMDSFQYTTTQIPRKWSNTGGVSSGSCDIETFNALYGRMLRLGSNIGSLEKPLGVSSTWSLSLSFMLSGGQLNPNESRNIIEFRDVGAVQLSVFTQLGRQIQIRRGAVTHNTNGNATTGGTALTGGEGTSVLDPDVWYQIEIKATFSASIGANAFQVRVTGPGIEEIITLASGQSTITTANAWADRIRVFGHLNSANARGGYYGGIYIDNSKAELLGNVRVAALFPNGNGATNQWLGSDGNSTDNYLLVDETTPNDDTDYTGTDTTGQIDLYELTNLPTAAQEILAVQHNQQMRKLDATDAYTEPIFRLGGTNYIESPIMVGNAYHNILFARDTSPATTDPWTESEVNALQAGMRSSF